MPLFFLINKADGLFDFIAVVIPLAYSDFTGITNWEIVLSQRAVYLFLGVSFLMWVSYSYQRLEQSFLIKKVLVLLIAAGFILVSFLVFNFLQHFNSGMKTRMDFNRINHEWSEYIPANVSKCDLSLVHDGNIIIGKADLLIKNNSVDSLQKILLSLNPGLEIQNITIDKTEPNYNRDLHLIIVELVEPLLPSDSSSILIEYSGTIDEAICFAEVDEEIRSDFYQVFIAKVDKKYAFVENNYLLLPPNCLWYPVSGLPIGAIFPRQNNIMARG